LDIARKGPVDFLEGLNLLNVQLAYFRDILSVTFGNQDIESGMLFVQLKNTFHPVTNLLKLNNAEQL